MRASEIRNWLGLYFLLITAGLGGYLLLGRGAVLPLRPAESTACFQIVIPVLVGQLTLIFKWFGQARDAPAADPVVNLPTWVVKGPPLVVVALLAIGFGALVAGSRGEGQSWAPAPADIKGLITFCVSILNATTIFILARFFKLD